MNKVIEALQYMAEHGGTWNSVTFLNVWRLGLVHDYFGFSQQDLQEFLKHYQEINSSTVTSKELPYKESDIASFFGTWPGDETDAELLSSLKNLDRGIQRDPETIKALIDTLDVILTDWKSLNKPGDYQVDYRVMRELDLILENLDEQIRKS